MTNIDPIVISKLAAGTFISEFLPKITSDISPHPLVKYLQGTRAICEAIIISHTEVASVLIISHDQLSELSIYPDTLYRFQSRYLKLSKAASSKKRFKNL